MLYNKDYWSAYYTLQREVENGKTDLRSDRDKALELAKAKSAQVRANWNALELTNG